MSNIPKHIAIIMDGNGRWAKAKGLPRIAGHKEGVNTVRKITEKCGEIGVKHLTLFTFSSENWSLQNSCPFCNCKSYYKRRDFNQILGAGIIILGGILSIIYNYFILMGFALLDVLLYYIVPDVAVCYQCSAELRGFHGMEKLEVFDHHTAELYQYTQN